MTNNKHSSKPSPPSLSQGSNQFFSLDSTIQDLPLYDFQVDINCLGEELAHIFEQYPLLPGAILTKKEQYLGMISRQQFLEYLLLPQGLELFLNQPLKVLYGYAPKLTLILPGATPILTAERKALRRLPEFLSEPIVVQIEPSFYRILDFNKLNIASWQIRGIETQARYERNQIKMIQSQKMASLGRLVDGVAKEILNPVGFIWGNLTYVSSYIENLMEILSAYEKHISDLPKEIVELTEDIELDFLREDLPRAIGSIKSGAERLKKLAESLQTFCYIDQVYAKPADIHACLDNVILMLKSNLNSEIEIVKNYTNIPPVNCYMGQLNQVFMNILTNAIDVLLNQAVAQQVAQELNQLGQQESDDKPRIEISTQIYSNQANQSGIPENRWVSIRIADNGPGMSESLQQQILDSFSLTRRSGKETSLAISYQTITAKHGGELKLRSQLGVGTEFEILLPLN